MPSDITREDIDRALGKILPRGDAYPYPDRPAVLVGEALEIVAIAAHRGRVLFPSICQTCGGSGAVGKDIDTPHYEAVSCPSCGGSGKEWAKETVDALALARLDEEGESLDGLIGTWAEEMMDKYRTKAIATLDALVALAEEKQ